VVVVTDANAREAERWNSSATVAAWVAGQARHDAMLAPFLPILFDGVRLAPGERVLDIGCGCGATTLEAARAVAPGSVLGADLSAPMLEQARADAARAALANVEFVRADAQVHPFESASFDAAISRFGVMFFSDPVAAFANVRRALRLEGRIAFACWQSVTANPWFGLPRRAMLEHVPPPPAVPADAPGPMALADPDRTRQLLRDAGWHDVDVAPHETSLLLGGPGSIDEAVEFVRTSSTGQTLLADVDAATASRALDAVRAALTPFAESDGVRLPAAVWLVTARA
jgi:SAM-dependent methyltransferase